MEQINRLENAEEVFELSNSWEEKGRAKGREESIEKVVLGMLKKELPVQLIAEVTDLPSEKIEKIKNTL